MLAYYHKRQEEMKHLAQNDETITPTARGPTHGR